MKFFHRVFENVPDQVVSTSLLFASVYVCYRGVLSVWNDPPSTKLCLIVLLLGIVLGILKSIGNNKKKI